MRCSAVVCLTLVVLCGLIAVVPALQARPSTQTQFRYVYRTQRRTRIFSATCQLCHETRRGGRKLNGYGRDLKRAGRYGKYEFEGYRAIEKLDSDKDGFTNAAEIAADKLPGARWSRPRPQKKEPLLPGKKSKKGKGEKKDKSDEKQDEEKPSSE